MSKLALEFAAAIALTIAAILALAPGVMASDVMVTDAFARASATPNASAGAAYLTVFNPGPDADRLIGVSTPAADMAHVHQTVMDNGTMRMPAVAAIDLPAGQAVELKPGGLHIMLMGLKAPLKRGETIELVLTFKTAGEVKVQVPVAGVAADRPDQAAGSSGG